MSTLGNNVYFDCAKKFKNEVLNFFNKTWDYIRLTMKSRINNNLQSLQNPEFEFEGV
jgi:hypothetical protein